MFKNLLQVNKQTNGDKMKSIIILLSILSISCTGTGLTGEQEQRIYSKMFKKLPPKILECAKTIVEFKNVKTEGTTTTLEIHVKKGQLKGLWIASSMIDKGCDSYKEFIQSKTKKEHVERDLTLTKYADVEIDKDSIVITKK